MASINIIQNAITRVKKTRQDAEKVRNRKMIEQTKEMEAHLQKQLVIARWEEKNARLRAEQAAAQKRIDKAKEKQRGLKYSHVDSTIKELKSIGKQLKKYF